MAFEAEMRQHGQAQATRSAHILVNRRAGRVLQMGRSAFAALVHREFERHGFVAQVEFVAARKLQRRLAEALQAKADLVVLAGGDGTVSQALAVLLRAEHPVAILPLGTLNLLGRDLGLTGDLAADIAALAQARPRAISLAQVNGRLFHSNAGFGMLSMMARERENARRAVPFSRALGFLLAAIRSLVTYRPIEVEIEGGTAGARRALKADTVLVTSNRFEGVPWTRARLDAGELEVHLLEAGGLAARLRLLWHIARGRWRDHPALTSFTCTRFMVQRARKNSIALAIDGERCRLHGPVVFDVADETLTLHA